VVGGWGCRCGGGLVVVGLGGGVGEGGWVVCGGCEWGGVSVMGGGGVLG